MQIKLNNNKMCGLLGLITFLLNEYPPTNKAERLLETLVEQVRIKIRNRLDQRNAKDSYSVKLTKAEAQGFEIWIGQLEMGIQPNTYIYEKSVAQHITNEIDRTYG